MVSRKGYIDDLPLNLGRNIEGESKTSSSALSLQTWTWVSRVFRTIRMRYSMMPRVPHWQVPEPRKADDPNVVVPPRPAIEAP